jgi:glycosyltransferase involved in cell wall biosynthesis
VSRNFLKIALVSKNNGCFGGASFFAECLGAWLNERGMKAVHFCLEPRQKLQSYQRSLKARSLLQRVARHLNWWLRRLGKLEPFSWEIRAGLGRQLEMFDVVHFHDLYMAVSTRTLELAGRRKPVVFTVHDCSSFTGGCLYPMSCDRFRHVCGGCPQRAQIGRFDFTRANLRRMRRLASSTTVNYVFPSRWIQVQAESALRICGSSFHVPNGFDPRAYAYPVRSAARKALGFEPNVKVVVLSASTLDDERKGIRFAIDSLKANRSMRPAIILIGHSSPALERELKGFDCLRAGFVVERARLGLLYAAADLLIFPSLADNLPITIQEAMAAGIPVLAFNVGGVPELVTDCKTGWLVPGGNQAALNRALGMALGSNDAVAMGEQARKFVAEECSVGDCVNRHLEVYNRSVESWARVPVT